MITELSHSPKDIPARRAASRAVSRASGRMPLTFQGTPIFMLTPSCNGEEQEPNGSCEPALYRREMNKVRGPILRTEFSCFRVNKRLRRQLLG
jgi:hypothetical protein